MKIREHDITGSETDGDVLTTVGGIPAWGSSGTSLGDVVVAVTNGVPMLMFDDDSTPVTTEVPS